MSQTADAPAFILHLACHPAAQLPLPSTPFPDERFLVWGRPVMMPGDDNWHVVWKDPESGRWLTGVPGRSFDHLHMAEASITHWMPLPPERFWE